MNVVRIDLPGALFSGAAALVEFADDAAAYERAVAAFAADGVEEVFWQDLETLGYSSTEIQLHIDQPGWRMPQGYVSTLDFP